MAQATLMPAPRLVKSRIGYSMQLFQYHPLLKTESRFAKIALIFEEPAAGAYFQNFTNYSLDFKPIPRLGLVILVFSPLNQCLQSLVILSC